MEFEPWSIRFVITAALGLPLLFSDRDIGLLFELAIQSMVPLLFNKKELLSRVASKDSQVEDEYSDFASEKHEMELFISILPNKTHYPIGRNYITAITLINTTLVSFPPSMIVFNLHAMDYFARIRFYLVVCDMSLKKGISKRIHDVQIMNWAKKGVHYVKSY